MNLESELFTLQDSNAKLVAALHEANANVEQWKKQLAAYQGETERLRDQVSPAVTKARAPTLPVQVYSSGRNEGGNQEHCWLNQFMVTFRQKTVEWMLAEAPGDVDFHRKCFHWIPLGTAWIPLWPVLMADR